MQNPGEVFSGMSGLASSRETELQKGCEEHFTALLSSFARGVNQTLALSACYAACTGNYFPTFRDNISVPYSRVNHSKNKNLGLLDPKMGQICCPETSESNYLPMLRKNPQIGDLILELYLNWPEPHWVVNRM